MFLDLGFLDLVHSLDLEHKSPDKMGLGWYINRYLDSGRLFSGPFYSKFSRFLRSTFSLLTISMSINFVDPVVKALPVFRKPKAFDGPSVLNPGNTVQSK